MDYRAFFNKITSRRNPTALREIFDSLGVDENYVLMAGGLPNPDFFPIRTADVHLSDGSTVSINESEMKVALQYGTTAGLPGLREFTKRLLIHFHDPPLMKEPDHPGTPYIVCTAGCQDGIYKVFECIADEEDTILMNEPAYPAVMSVLAPIGCNVVGIKTDINGIIPEHLAEVLSKWKRPDDNQPARDSKGGKLKALYVIPNGGNPSGLRYTLERKQEIYRLAQEYNFLIIEDEAYFFLEKKPYTKSFLSLDVDGRVIRLDTFSKTIGPGFRIGTVTGPIEITKKVRTITMASSQGCSVVSQMILMKLLEKWGLDGYIEHCERLAEFYEKRRIQCMEIVDKHLKGLVEYDAPSGGMFLWLKCHVIKDTMKLCVQNLMKRKVLMVAGSAFLVKDDEDSQYIRVSFTLATLEQLELGFRILAEELRALTGETPQINGN